ncbi:MAG: TraB/GumN family protein [Cellulosilyticaceae bacterium]
MLKFKGSFKKPLITALLIIGTLNFYAPCQADTVQRPDDWALSELYEAEVSGILPLDWQQTLHQVITADQLRYIIRGLEEKLALAGLEKEVEVGYTLGTTRQQVLEVYYQVLRQYGEQLDLGSNAITYMIDHKIVAGDKDGNINNTKPCTVQEATLFANRLLGQVYDVLDEGSKGYMWEVTRGNHTVYLLGSVHLSNQELYPFNEDLNGIIQKVDKVAFEVDFNDQRGMAYFLQKQMYTGDTNLKADLPEELYRDTIQIMKEIGLSEEQAIKYKPWAIANLIPTVKVEEAQTSTQTTGTLPTVDAYIYTKSLIADKEILELEGYVFQADMYDEMALDLQIGRLEESIQLYNEETDEETDAIDTAIYWGEAFREGDIEGFTYSYPKDELLQEEDAFMQMLFSKRDEQMTKKVIEYLLSPGDTDYLVVAGAGHMIGEQGIVARLQKLGYQVKPVYH